MISALIPLTVSRPVVHQPRSTTSPRPKVGNHPKMTPNTNINKMPIKKGEEDESTFASRMDAWQNHMETIHNQASVIISKNRHGPTGDVTLYFDGSTTKFSDYVPDDRYAGSPGY